MGKLPLLVKDADSRLFLQYFVVLFEFPTVEHWNLMAQGVSNKSPSPCLLQTPFTLTLRLWDIFMLEGDRLLTAMAYNIMKMHRSEILFQFIATSQLWKISRSPCPEMKSLSCSAVAHRIAGCWFEGGIREFKIYDSTVTKTSLKMASSSLTIFSVVMSICSTFKSWRNYPGT